jgi:hypothetical protein
MVSFLIELRRTLMRRSLPTSPAVSACAAMGRPELAGWRGLRRPEVAKMLNYEMIGYLEVSNDNISFGLRPQRPSTVTPTLCTSVHTSG